MCASKIFVWGNALCLSGFLLLSATHGFGQQSEAEKARHSAAATQERSQSPQHPESAGETAGQQATGESMEDPCPSLGVLVAPSPGQGVLVLGALRGSPAADMGIQPGDYIMTVNQRAVSTASELQDAVSQLNLEQPAEVQIWRNGQTITESAKLARQADQRPDSHRAWMGVVLTPSHDQQTPGVEVSRVFPQSPAEQAGLEAGDIITKAGEHQVTGIETLLSCLEDHAPNTGCALEVSRNGETKKIRLKLGDVNDAPEAWISTAFRVPIDLLNIDDGIGGGGDEQLQATVEQLRREVEAIRARLDAIDPSNRRAPQDRDDQRQTPDRTPGQLDGDSTKSGLTTDQRNAELGAALALAGGLNPSVATGSFLGVQESGRRGARAFRSQGNWNRTYPRSGYTYYRPGYYYYPNYNYGTWYYPYRGNRWYYNYDYYNQPRFGIQLGPFWGAYWY